jgi:hypothetical protein
MCVLRWIWNGEAVKVGGYLSAQLINEDMFWFYQAGH